MNEAIGNFCNVPFWDLNLTWYNHVPEFTSCFEDIVLVSSPCIFYLFVLLFSLWCTPGPLHSPLPWTWLNISKMFLSVSLLVMSCVWCVLNFYEKFSLSEKVPLSSLLASSSKVALYLIIPLVMLRHRSCGVTTSTALSTFWIISSLCSIVSYRSAILNYFIFEKYPASGPEFILNMLFYPVIFLQLFLSIFTDRKKYSLLQDSKIRNEVSFLAHITYLWFIRIIHMGRKRLLTSHDLKFPDTSFLSNSVYNTFVKHWKYYLLLDQPKNPSLAFALLKAFLPLIALSMMLNFAIVVFNFLPPLVLDRIIDFSQDDYYVWRGYLFVFLLFAVDFIGKVLQNNCVNVESISTVYFQASLMGALLRKNLSLSTFARKEYPSGTIMNLLSVDVKRIQWFLLISTNLITAPAKIIIIIVILWQYIGPAALAGVVVMVFLFPISYFIARKGEIYSEKQMSMKDLRLKHLSEMLNGIKILKLYAWEIPFSKKVTDARKLEIKWVRFTLLCYVVMNFVYFCAPIMVSIASFTTFLMLDKHNVLSPTKAFVTLTLMDQLRYALFQLPDAISDLIQFNVCLNRLRKFFCAKNKDDQVVGNNPNKGEAITIKSATCTWSSDSDFVLKKITLHVPKGKLIAIIGPVGAGKTSLISAVLGEMDKTRGSLDIKGSVAYVPQQPWVLNRSLKDNILLVKNFNEEKYEKVLDLCCLKPDLEILPSGDRTEIGEKGVNLSGGQKLRVNLAQAVYQDRDIYLLDDPLSAVDVHVRKALFQDVIGNTGLLKNKTRVLVTHDVSVLHNVDLIVSMKDGCIDEIGTYNELINHNGSFYSFIQEHSKVQTVEEIEPERNLLRLVSSESGISKASQDGDYAKGDVLSVNADLTETEAVDHRLTEDERMEVGGVNRKIYINYVREMGIMFFAAAAFFYLGFSGFEAGANIWLSKWSADSLHNGTSMAETTSRASIYGAMGLGQVFCIILGNVVLVFGATGTSERYHNNMLKSVMQSPMSFFDSTPNGRIINRFTTDLDILDIQLFYRVDGWLNCLFTTLSALIIIGINTPIFFAVLVPMAAFYYMMQYFHLTTFRQLRRLDSINKSPVFSYFMETIQGVSSISAYKIQKEVIESFETKLDTLFVCTYNSYLCNRWLSFCLDLLGSVIILVSTTLAIYNREELGPAVVGLIGAYSLLITDSMKWFVRMNSELEDKSISVERVDEYCKLKPEAPWDLPQDGMEENWPKSGNITFDNYSTRYRENLDLVLKEVSLSIEASEKVGIIGRTGAGKSSITLALFRVLEPASGAIYVDNVDISKLGLHNLRSKLTIIPQDPVLFTGTMRINLDPNEEHSDEEIWSCLEKAHLKSFVTALSEGLEYKLDECGGNLSAGQRQLVCLARALLKNSKILVLDEATASVDMDTDSLIQNTIRTAFAKNTVITIAHRIHTVLDYDKIVVMERGSVVEVGNPKALLADPTSKFFEMNQETQH